ncbi:DUF4876 domain-containing protein [Parabacteroides sp. Marseille-P3160]|uniref:DUF4876 domain-containing protein n=1 Tax=Parabacteroides sp. Marseille-P3160 TaxID=1917887 RepID=UPI0009BA4708|nr:DUF4876 domain-containing protein [Parabacteroides sp. Marseille-P3160]
MKLTKLLFLLIIALLLGVSCSDNDDPSDYQTYDVTVKLVYPSDYESVENVTVTLVNTGNNTTYEDSTNVSGEATFSVPVGIYQATVTDKRSVSGSSVVLNGMANISVGTDWVATTPVELSLTASKAGSVVIKELYAGGCQKDDGSGKFQRDPYVILYNNSENEISLENMALGIALPYGMTTSNKYYGTDGKLSYEAENWIPAGDAIWHFKNTVSIPAGEEIVIALQNAVDNTVTYSNSINFANAEYYCTYDVSGQYKNTTYYPSPSEVIPTDHYLSSTVYGIANAWPLSVNSPAFFIFSTEGTTPAAYAANVANQQNYPGTTQVVIKVPVEWVVDAVEVKGQGVDGYKRLTSTVDAGYVTMISGVGYSIYRNVDREATEAIEENSGKLVYNYSLGTTSEQEGSTDPSGIDAEASIKKGARIVYKDTNNSTNDFHQRSRASLKD